MILIGIFIVVFLVLAYYLYNIKGNIKGQKIKDTKGLIEFESNDSKDALEFIKKEGAKFYSKKKDSNLYIIIKGDFSNDKLEKDEQWDTYFV